MSQFTEYTSKIHLFHLLDQTDDKLFFIDRNYIYRAANKAYVKGFNRRVNEIIGCHIQEIIGIEVFENEMKSNLDRAFMGEKVENEGWFYFPESNRFYLIVRYCPTYSGENEIIGVVVTCTDLTEHKRLQEEKVLQDKLLLEQTRMAQIGEVVAFIAHQWRRPLHTLSTYLLRIRREMEDQSCEGFDKELERSEEILEHLSQSLENLYHFHSDEGGTIKIKISIEEVGRLLEPNLNAANIVLTINVSDAITIASYLPVSRLLHLFWVFIENAIESFEQSDREEKKIIVGGYEDNEAVIIDIQDNGNGITCEQGRFIFKAGVSSKEGASHGYGLYFAHKILTEQLGGSIVMIPVDEGTLFRLRLPKQHSVKG